MSYTITGNGTVPTLSSVQAAIDSLSGSVNTALTMAGNPFIDITKPPYNAKVDGLTDDTVAWQTALDAVAAAGGGSLFCPSGTTLISGAGVSHTLASLGLYIHAYGVEMKYSGAGVPITVTKGGGTAQSHLPSVVVAGLNVIPTAAATAGMQFNSCLGGRTIDCSVICRSGGTVVNSFLFTNTNNYFTEDFSMDRCYGGVGATNASVALLQTTGTNSFARFTMNDFQVGGGTYVVDIQKGSMYDSSINNIRGNFSGDAFIRIRNTTGPSDMDGSWVRGIHTERGATTTPKGIIMVDDATAKVPVLMDEGNFKGSGYVSAFVDTAFNPITPTTFYKTLSLHNPLACDGALTALSTALTKGTKKSVLDSNTVALALGGGTGTVTTTNAIWVPASGGAAGDITLFATLTGGAGGAIAKFTFAAEGSGFTQTTAVIQAGTRSGYYGITLSNVVVNATGTVSFTWTYGGGAPAATLTWTVVQDVMAI